MWQSQKNVHNSSIHTHIKKNLAYYQNWLTGHKNKTEIYDTLFNGLGLSGLRMGNWAQEDDKDLSDDAEIAKEAKKRLGSEFFIEISS